MDEVARLIPRIYFIVQASDKALDLWEADVLPDASGKHSTQVV